MKIQQQRRHHHHRQHQQQQHLLLLLQELDIESIEPLPVHPQFPSQVGLVARRDVESLSRLPQVVSTGIQLEVENVQFQF